MGELPDEEEKVVSQRWNHESKCSLTSSSSLSLTSARLDGGEGGGGGGGGGSN